jgi:hypothetical protein
MQSSPASRHLLPLSSKYSPQHPVLRHPPSVYDVPLVWETKFHTHKNRGWNDNSVYFNLQVFRPEAGR